MKTLGSILSMIFLVTACGGSSGGGSTAAPVALTPGVTTPTQTAGTPAPAGVVTTQAFTFTQPMQICAALRAWNPTTTKIQFPGDPGGYAIYLFTATGIYQNGQVLTTFFNNIGTGGTPVCSITITAGKLVSVQ